ncbi:MAG: gliding motility-associated ABC transporter ATP-binding subunit GldA [Bacteroidetes bacterium]|nr:gliding motility-associated ABC transporter ATP-binding subunit GldA [Bacteroidota bacterium]
MSISIQHLTKIYDEQKAVDDISFDVKRGEVVGFLGPNGAGKSTTMKIISCFIPQTEGTATVCGFDVNQQSMDVRRQIGYLPENNPLYTDMYVREYLSYVAKMYKLGRSASGRIEKMVEITGLKDEQKKKIGQLSKGYRQRVGLAQALLHDPNVLILDEPTSGLDPNQVLEIRKLISELGEEKTVILSTHIMQEVKAVCSRIIIINKGKIVADDSTAEMLKRVSGQIVITVEFNKSPTESDLRNIEDVAQVEALGNNRFQLYSDSKVDLRQKVFDFAVASDLKLLSMQEEEQSLEEVFHELTKERND